MERTTKIVVFYPLFLNNTNIVNVTLTKTEQRYESGVAKLYYFNVPK